MRYLVKLNFTSPVHFGKRRLIDSEVTIKADTLFSALFIESLNLGIDESVLLNNIIISDTFPFVNDEYYLPKPLIKITSVHSDDYKSFKKLMYMPIERYNDYLLGNITGEEAKDIHESFEIGDASTYTKVSLINEDEDAEPYSVGTFRFKENAGLYFIVESNDEDKVQLERILTSLQFSGLGGKRFSGYGKFNYEIIDEPPASLEQLNVEQNILLSNAMCNEDELNLITETDKFILDKRSGFIQSDTFSSQLVKKRDVFCFKAGSVFTNQFKGVIFDVGENGNHPVYKYAKAMWIGGSK